MGKVIKKKYDRYTLEYKLRAIQLADHPDITAIAVAESLGIHPVMLYRWRLEKKNGTLRSGYSVKKKSTTKTKPAREPGANLEAEAELVKAQKRIKELEKSLAANQEELDILKKAKRFFSKAKK
ncbi:transposase [Thiohalobacter thiocyanaticus]|uniref:Transposase n=1 Tax=Thiohalobacter thiocyanaticus TaxID=585455 RepID=A0A1Z4VU65_9GAMM|nr:transposase [Thiohalobacter thiocyanaticus]BAZ94898.1 transposase [Thiohalobacter thiocyanaticus]